MAAVLERTPDRARSRPLPTYDHCFCCGAANDCGLRLTFRADGELAFTDWVPEARSGGYRGIVHGGVAAAVLDEALGWGAYLGSQLMVVTVDLAVRYVRPVAIGEPVVVVAWMIANQRDRIVHAMGELAGADGVVRMRAKGRFMPLPAAEVAAVRAYLTDASGAALPYRNR